MSEYIEPKWETVYFQAPFDNGRWSATQCTVGDEVYAYYINWYEPYSTLPPHYKLQITNTKDTTKSSWQVCLSHEIAHSRVMSAIKDYEKKYNLHDPRRCKSCNNVIEDKLESDFGYTYFEQTPSVY
jgi:hypothetical protein